MVETWVVMMVVMKDTLKAVWMEVMMVDWRDNMMVVRMIAKTGNRMVLKDMMMVVGIVLMIVQLSVEMMRGVMIL